MSKQKKIEHKLPSLRYLKKLKASIARKRLSCFNNIMIVIIIEKIKFQEIILNYWKFEKKILLINQNDQKRETRTGVRCLFNAIAFEKLMLVLMTIRNRMQLLASRILAIITTDRFLKIITFDWWLRWRFTDTKRKKRNKITSVII